MVGGGAVVAAVAGGREVVVLGGGAGRRGKLRLSAEKPRSRDGTVPEAVHLEQRVGRADELHRRARPRVREGEDARICQVRTACHQYAH